MDLNVDPSYCAHSLGIRMRIHSNLDPQRRYAIIRPCVRCGTKFDNEGMFAPIQRYGDHRDRENAQLRSMRRGR